MPCCSFIGGLQLLNFLLLLHFTSRSSNALSTSDDDTAAGLYWRDLSVTTTGTSTTTLLHSISGSVLNGKTCGVIGPSGSGKSTFLVALGGYGTASASTRVHGHVWLQSKEALEKTDHGWDESSVTRSNSTGTTATFVSPKLGHVAYLQQQDSFFHLLTVRETMELASYLEYPTKLKSERHELVDRTLDALGLGSVAHRLVGEESRSYYTSTPGLSGGERRRLSVGLELLTTPLVFLADESTTGLDSSQAVKIVKLIVELAKERNIPAILTLHQPRASIWKMLDSFVLLAPGGRVCYSGPRQSALKYFQDLGYSCPEETNPAEFFIDLVSVDTEDPELAMQDEARIEYLVRAFREKQKEDSQKVVPFIFSQNASSRRMGTFIRRFSALLLRSWRQNIRNTHYNLARLIGCVGCSCLFSQIFKSVRADVPYPRSIADRTTLLSFGVINMSMMALMKTVHLFAKERGVVEREQTRQQYSSVEYLISKVLAEIPLDTAFAAIFTTVLKALTGLRISWAKLTSTFAVMTAAGASLGFAIGSCAKDGDTAMQLALPIMVLFMVVGVINPSGVDKKSPPSRIIRWLRVLSPIRWAVEGAVIGEFDGIDLRPKGHMPWQRLQDLPKFGAFAMVQNGDQILASLGLEDATFNGVITKMSLLSIVNLCVSWIGLEVNRKGSRHASKKSFNEAGSHQSRRDTNAPVVTQIPLVLGGH